MGTIIHIREVKLMKLTNDCNDTNNGFLENYARNFIHHIDSLVERSMKTFLC